ncbi:SAM-dependent methyltransferase [Clostridium sp. chh4-2]|uniref:class I SAM-dependent methyltransferase n=1 Tax=Clostridium sp. chh4-2 TaxID=2067550 RepID=UPI000CCE635C|nr:class I SAM-dependent methyltransferase [Clostridium sp. chh4-2]PNV63405.1 SAM-dependent methyltransferase [Clostridium sp. chh4-2]
MYDGISKIFELPKLYKESEAAFWDDDYISKQMLKAHLDPDFNGASRKLDFIEKSVSWIKQILPSQKYPSLLDVGCGPGLYAERFTTGGYLVTGVDFSRRSIGYARHSAQRASLNIHYICQNYLALDIDKTFDLSTMIYCDYGALSTENRRIILQNIYKHLKSGGKLLLDVFSMAEYNNFQEQQTWELHKLGGFWREKEYVEVNKFCKFSDNVTLDQYIIISDKEIAAYYLWNTYFTKETLAKEAREAGFEICGIYSDVAGRKFCEESPTIAILLRK